MDSTLSINIDLKAFLLADSSRPVAVIIRGRQKVRLERNTVRFLTTALKSDAYFTPLVKSLQSENYKFIFLSSKESPDIFSIYLNCGSTEETLQLPEIERLLALKESSFRLAFDFLEDFEQQFTSIFDTIASVQSMHSHSKLKVVCYDCSSNTQFRIPPHLIVRLLE